MLKNIIKRVIGKKNISNLYSFIHPKLKLEKNKIKERIIFFSSFLNKGDLCFDVGANLGNRIEPLLYIGAKIVAIEPQESCYQYLENKFKNKIQIVKKGLCEKECLREFHISNASTISSFSKDWINSVKQERFKNYTWDQKIEIEMTTLDILIEEFGKPRFIKIDVEGYEFEVLLGLSKQIEIISFEYTVPEQIFKIKDCVKQVFNFNHDIKCNFSEGESMKWNLNEWLNIEDFLKLVETDEFIKTGFGDIYLKVHLPNN
jgi:FkbM family methyltransferase